MTEILHKCIGYKFFKKVDISMQYFTFSTDEEIQYICTICTQFGMYKYAWLPMGLIFSPEISQAAM